MRSTAGVGLAILIATGAPAVAKDLPRGEPVRHATGCEWAGPDFAKAEGTDTCVRVGGSVRAEFSHSTTKPAYLPGLPDN